ncbi:hypothetical protein [Paenibacillus sp. LPE1-1-1.1]|uniref:hypothetical protein n=1 Tax=Paenibacillus sp. LPE1-1-1.1 TaxID=3135230 RepID=UPI0034369D80
MKATIQLCSSTLNPTRNMQQTKRSADTQGFITIIWDIEGASFGRQKLNIHLEREDLRLKISCFDESEGINSGMILM